MNRSENMCACVQSPDLPWQLRESSKVSRPNWDFGRVAVKELNVAYQNYESPLLAYSTVMVT